MGTAKLWRKASLYAIAITFTLFMLIPLWLIFIAAFSSAQADYSFPKPFLPTQFSTYTIQFFLNSAGVIPSVKNSVWVGVITLLISLAIGTPAGYALARFRFPGSNLAQVLILATRSFPVIILSIPLAVTFITWGLYDTVQGVALVHTAMALPTTALITASVFYGVPRDLEEAAQTLGCSPLKAFLRISLPIALPGLAAAALFTFVLSWNEVFAAAILTVNNRTLPAQILTTLNEAPLQYQFAGAFIMIAPSLVFILVIRRYLVAGWSRVAR